MRTLFTIAITCFSTQAQVLPEPCGMLVPGTPIAASNPTAPAMLDLAGASTVQLEILGHSENRGYHTFLQQLLDAAPPLPGVTFVVTNRFIGGHEAWRWATPGQLGYSRIDAMLQAQQHPMIVLGLFSNNVSFPVQAPDPGDPNFTGFVDDLAAIADHCHDNGNGAAMVYLSSHRYKPANVQPCFYERAAVEHLIGTVAPGSGRNFVKAGPEQHDLHWCCHPTCYAPDNAHTNALGDELMATAWYHLLWRELRGCSREPYGAGTPGTGGTIPILSPTATMPELGAPSFVLEMHDVLPATVTAIAVGDGAAAGPLLVTPLLSWVGLSDAQGGYAISFTLPSSPSLHGVPLFAQGAAFDPAGTFLSFALSQGLRITLCQ